MRKILTNDKSNIIINIKNTIILIALLSVSAHVSGQADVIDMVSFEKYLISLDSAKACNDNQKIINLNQLYGKKYGRSSVSSRAQKTGENIDREACAYMAAYYENDYDSKKKLKYLLVHDKIFRFHVNI